jgi:hypothetical protein
MSAADRFLPPELARSSGFEHVFVRPSQTETIRRDLILAHCAGHVSDGDAEPFLLGVRDCLDGISLGGHGFAISSGFLDRRLLPGAFDNPDACAQRLARIFGEPANSSGTAGMREWLDWAQRHPEERLNWRDRFFIEQRQAGWLSSKEQLYDMGDLERFHILNASRTSALLLGIPEPQRHGSLIQKELIGRIAPDLLQYPFNPPDRYFGVLKAFTVRSREDPFYFVRKSARKLTSLSRRLLARTRPNTSLPY